MATARTVAGCTSRSQSLIFSAVLYGYGLGLFGSEIVSAGIAFGILVYLTHRRRQPMQRPPLEQHVHAV
jgi:hypothetical protein